MKQSELDNLAYRHATLVASPNTSNGQRADSETILQLLDQIQFYQDELDRVRTARAEGRRDAAGIIRKNTAMIRDGKITRLSADWLDTLAAAIEGGAVSGEETNEKST